MPHPVFPRSGFTESLPYGYLYLGKSVDPRKRGPFVRASAERAGVLDRYKTVARRLEATDVVVKATVYEAVLMPPLAGMPQFDVLMLVQTSSHETIAQAQATDAYQDFDADFILTACNLGRFGDTDSDPAATFLFNHFTAPDQQVAAETLETLAAWFAAKTDVDNSTALQPTGQSPYAVINYVRIPTGPVRFLLSQLTKPSFYSVVRAQLKHNNMAPLPLFCHRA